MYRNILYSVLIVILFSCAKQGFPPGGPVDKRPPRILSTIPPMDTINVALHSDIMLEFNEGVEKKSCEESVFITPYPGENIKYKWKGKKLYVELLDGLLKDRTYVITIGAGTKDLRNNAMLESFSLAFSTGGEIDRGIVSGIVKSDQNITGAEIWAYDLTEDQSPNPSTASPIYVTQANQDGTFKLGYLAKSKYRIFAVLDRDKNGLYEEEFDQIGVSSKDADLTGIIDNVDFFNFQVTLADTTLPDLSMVSAPDNKHLILRFSEVVAGDFVNRLENYTIADDHLQILDVFQDNRNGAYIHLTTKEQQNMDYVLTVNRMADKAGNLMPPDSGLFKFTGSTVPDTAKPRYILMLPADSSTLVPLDTEIEFIFSEAMDSSSIKNQLVVADTMNNVVNGNISWKNGPHVVFHSAKELAEDTIYIITLPVDSVFDVAGNPLEDTLFVKRFTTVSLDTLSEISGTITDRDTSATGPFFIKAQATTGREYEKWIDGNEYIFEKILPGDYMLNLFRDEDENGIYSIGEPFPFKTAERFLFYKDTISVRSKWPNEANDILFPQ
jgi:hypothetical protein